MIDVLMNSRHAPQARYALSVLSSCLGISVVAAANRRRTPLLLSYGSVPAPAIADQIVIHVPEDSDCWSGNHPPEDVCKLDYTWNSSNTIHISADCIYAIYYYLTLQQEKEWSPDQHGRITLPDPHAGDAAAYVEPLLNRVLSVIRRAFVDALTTLRLPYINFAAWPQAKQFAAFLSHDVDRIYDREFFQLLSSANRLYRVVRKQISGSARLAFGRLIQSLIRPRDPLHSFSHLLRIEGRYDFKSTFFMLEDRCRTRYGASYRFSDKEVNKLAHLISGHGNELGLHGGYYAFNNAEAYATSRRSVEDNFGFRPEGIRNHYMRFSYPETWQAHTKAGFAYDSTLGYFDVPGYRSRLAFPFAVFDAQTESVLDLIELPLTIMEGTLFDYQSMSANEAFQVVDRAISDAEQNGGLVTLLWHNNYFNDPEFAAWEDVYRQALGILKSRDAHVATGREIVSWWQKRARARILTDSYSTGVWKGHLEIGAELEDLVVEIVAPTGTKIQITGGEYELLADGPRIQVAFGHLAVNSNVMMTLEIDDSGVRC